MISVLAACGGGGGGGSTNPPVTSPGSSGGGGGGSTPTPGPTSTPAPGQSSTPAPTPTPTSPPVGTSSEVVYTYDGITAGTDNWQTNGVTTASAGDGDTAAGGNSANNFATFDQVSCAIATEPAVAPVTYHVHSFVGIIVNGTKMAIPDAIGMNTPDNNEPILGFKCAYNIHTHSASGIIHMEDPSIAGNWNTSPAVQPPAKYNLQALLDIWGQSPNGLAGGAGMPTVYFGDINGAKYTPPGSNSQVDLVNSFTLYTGNLNALLLQHHRAIWLVYGTVPAAGLPQVAFGIQN